MAAEQSTFDTLLGKLSSLIGSDTPEATAYGMKNALAGFPGANKVTNALNPDPQVTNRASMLPIGNYDDGSVGMAWPQSAVDAYEALGRFGRGENPQPQDAVLAGLAMAGSGFGGLGRAAGRAVSGAAPESAATLRPLTSHSVEAGSAPVSARVYRGTSDPEQWPPAPVDADYFDTFWATSNPSVADTYARVAGMADVPAPHIIPADMHFQNPMRVDARGGGWEINAPGLASQPLTPEELAKFARQRGHDGLIIQNVRDSARAEYGSGPIGDTYAALRPGTVKSATTGETLFSNPKEAAPAGLLASSGLDRMRVEDAARPRSPSIYDLPPSSQFIPEQSFGVSHSTGRRRGWDARVDAGNALDINKGDPAAAKEELLAAINMTRGMPGFSQQFVDALRHVDNGTAVRAADTARGDDYLRQLTRMLDPDFEEGSTLQSGGLPGLLAQNAPSYLNQRGYQNNLPPPVQKFEQSPEGADAYMKALMNKIGELQGQGMSLGEATKKAQEDPELNALWRKSMGMP